MRGAQVDTPHLSLPFQLASDGRSVSVEEQDSIEEIRDCVELTLRYPTGHRPELPEFGTPDLTFRQAAADGLDLADVEAVVATWEPRVEVLIEDAPELADETVRNVTVRMRGT